MPNHGLYESCVLGLDVQVDKDRLRFFAGTALLLDGDDLVARLQERYDDAQRRAEEAEREVARLREELERLKR